MTLSTAGGTCVATMRWSLAMLLTCLLIVYSGAASSVRAQSDPRAAANQLHTAIVNGDVESLRYWLIVRHADASAANAAEPDVTPLQRCVGLAARTLDAPRAREREPRETSAPVVSLRTLQAIATLLYVHGARLTEADRLRFTEPVLRWYDDAVSTSDALAQPHPDPARATADSSSKSAFTLRLATIMVMAEPGEPCNGGGHAVYLVNQTQLSVTAKVTMYEDAAESTNGRQRSESYTVDADNSWRLGCDALTDGRRVRYVLNDWR